MKNLILLLVLALALVVFAGCAGTGAGFSIRLGFDLPPSTNSTTVGHSMTNRMGR